MRYKPHELFLMTDARIFGTLGGMRPFIPSVTLFLSGFFSLFMSSVKSAGLHLVHGQDFALATFCPRFRFLLERR